ncbi:MAG TPA: hypothetical protein VGR78_08940 [Verrucomicrobiae bacterium]|jgi:hypothetical protein|nr:hypothetical protein [Verrucomicrobiae bacterium]
MRLTKFQHLKLAALLLLAVPCHALQFNYSFVNTDGFGTALGSVVKGTINGLNDNTVNFQKVTVTLDSISGSDALGYAPHGWTDFGVFTVSGGLITEAAFSSNDGTLGIDLNTSPGGRGLVFPLPGFVPFYRNGTPEITFTPVAGDLHSTGSAVPDSSTNTLALLAGSAAGLLVLRRRGHAKSPT